MATIGQKKAIKAGGTYTNPRGKTYYADGKTAQPGRTGSGGGSSSPATPGVIPAYNAATGATTGKPSAEYDAYLKSLSRVANSPNFRSLLDDSSTVPTTSKLKDGIKPSEPVTPISPQVPPQAPGVGLGNAQVDQLGSQGYREGDIVPGRGTLLPDGTFSNTPSLAENYNQIAQQGPPPGTDIDSASDAKSKVTALSNANQGAPVPPGGQEIMDYFDNDENKELAGIEKAYSDFYSPKNQKNNLMATYQSLLKESGLADINAELIDAKRIIDGTEDDIRTEITKASGFATDSQVQAMTNARNKSLIANYNTLLETKQAITEQIGNMMQYAQADRTYAAQQFESRMNFELKKVEYGRQARQFASTQLQKIADTVGYSGLLAMTGGDPYATAKVEQALGLGQGGLTQLASIPEPGDLQFVSGTENQPMGYFDKNTGKFTRLGGGGGGTGGGINTAGLTPEQLADPFIAKMLASKGGKPLTDTFAQQLNKGLTVLSQIGTLQTNIQNTPTGPIAGAFRGANPWDTNAQTIKAQLNAIVPNLARGVYGEVGVLTDADVKNYSQTLPNLKSPEDIRNAVLGITVDLIGKSVRRNLEINAANGKDVSGFVDIYTEMQNTKDSIFSQIPGYKGSTGQAGINLTPEDNAVADSVLGPASSAPTTSSSGSWWESFKRGLGF